MKISIKLTVIVGFVTMVALIIVTAGVAYMALVEAVEGANRHNEMARDTKAAHEIGSNVMLLDAASDSYLINRDIQSVWDIDYRLARTRRMAQRAKSASAIPQVKDVFDRVDDILARFSRNFEELKSLDASRDIILHASPINEIELERIQKRRKILQNFFSIATMKVTTNFETIEQELRIHQESINSRLQRGLKSTTLVLGISVGVAVILAGIIAVLFVRWITKPVGFLEQIVKRSPSVAFRLRAEPGWPVEFVSQNVSQLGYSMDTFLSGRINPIDLVHPEDRDTVLEKLRHVSRSEEKESEVGQEYRIITGSGDTRWLEQRMWIVRNDKDSITHYEGIVIDVTSRKLSEEKLELERARNHSCLETFGSYLSDEIVEEILESQGEIDIGGELREISVMVSDLRGFTKITESIDSKQLIRLLNRYLEAMTNIIVRYHGTIDEFTGDGILVFFGAPRPFKDHVKRSVLCAIEMQNMMDEFNKESLKLGLPELKMGIGINTGPLVVGSIGSQKRRKYGAVGKPINIAFRVQTQTAGGEILVTESVYKQIPSDIILGLEKETVLKGIEGSVKLYQIIGVRTCQLLRSGNDAYVVNEGWV